LGLKQKSSVVEPSRFENHRCLQRSEVVEPFDHLAFVERDTVEIVAGQLVDLAWLLND
jgi:hypothetical protein